MAKSVFNETKDGCKKISLVMLKYNYKQKKSLKKFSGVKIGFAAELLNGCKFNQEAGTLVRVKFLTTGYVYKPG